MTERWERRKEQLTRAADKAVDRWGPKIGTTPVEGDLHFEPDGPVCTGAQKGYVHQAVKAALEQGILKRSPKLTEELTIGEAEGILWALGADPRALSRKGRAFGAGKEQRAWRRARQRQ